MSEKLKRILIPIAVTGTIIILITAVLPCLLSGETETEPTTFHFEKNTASGNQDYDNNQLILMTLNTGHGRGNGLTQLLQSRKKIEKNAYKIAETVFNEKIDILALQEVDGPSFWNGGLNLIKEITEKSKFKNGIWSKNVEGLKLDYGTAILSDLSYSNAKSRTFKARPFVLPKGFTLAIFKTAEFKSGICVVSVHLDPLLASIRQTQSSTIIKTLKEIDKPIIIMGDFNCGYSKKSTVKMIADELDLQIWEPESKTLGTYNIGNRRLDWIMISKEFEFIDYNVLDYKISDHHAVKAVIRHRKNYSSGEKSSFDAPQRGQHQSSGRSANAVPAATPLSGSPSEGS